MNVGVAFSAKVDGSIQVSRCPHRDVVLVKVGSGLLAAGAEGEFHWTGLNTLPRTVLSSLVMENRYSLFFMATIPEKPDRSFVR